jgi:hypothetical protein
MPTKMVVYKEFIYAQNIYSMEQFPNNAPEAEQELAFIFNCAWCHPNDSPERRALEGSLKPNEAICDGICQECQKKHFGNLTD